MKEETLAPAPLLHPHMDVLQTTLERQKYLLELLESKKRKLNEMIDSNVLQLPEADSSFELQQMEYVIINYKIDLLKIEDQIKAQKRSVQVKEQHFIEYMKQFVIDCNDCDKFYDIVIDKATKMATSNKNIKDIMDKVVWSAVEKNVEVKIDLFKRLVKLTK